MNQFSEPDACTRHYGCGYIAKSGSRHRKSLSCEQVSVMKDDGQSFIDNV